MRNTQKQRPIRDWRGRARDAAIGVLIGLSVGTSAVANPQGPQVVHGQANFARPDGSTLNITNSPNAIINWQSFGVGTHETTRFIQQSSSSAVLNRVTGGAASQIFGQLQSNGRVFLINPQGIVFGPNATVDTAGLIASTLDIANEDFLAGRLSFTGSSDSGALDNQGFIKAGPDGSVFLIAPNIRNSGIVQTDGGRLVLVAGEQVRLVSLDSAELSYVVQAPEHEVVNLGALLTGGGAASVFAGTLRQHGEVNANAVVRDAAGNIQLVARRDVELGEGSKTSANGPNAGTIRVDAREGAAVVSGEIEAVGAEGTGGNIDVFGE
ncbi:MAG: filamentous hemagglutinin N-terminal domain-containing protein, partial [Gammaproteobacteria bacterium]